MKQTEINDLQARIKQLEQEVHELSYSPSYKVLTRAAVERRWLSMDKQNKSIVVFDIDNLHDHNVYYGHEEMNKRISKALDSCRGAELLGLVYSGDEFVIIAGRNEVNVISMRLRDSFANVGITFTAVICEIYSLDFNDNYQRAVAKISKLKQGNNRNTITHL